MPATTGWVRKGLIWKMPSKDSLAPWKNEPWADSLILPRYGRGASTILRPNHDSASASAFSQALCMPAHRTISAPLVRDALPTCRDWRSCPAIGVSVTSRVRPTTSRKRRVARVREQDALPGRHQRVIVPSRNQVKVQVEACPSRPVRLKQGQPVWAQSLVQQTRHCLSSPRDRNQVARGCGH